MNIKLYKYKKLGLTKNELDKVNTFLVFDYITYLSTLRKKVPNLSFLNLKSNGINNANKKTDKYSFI